MNGILLINKPKDYTSHDIVAVIKRLTNEKVGHTGTLDPNATGVLPLLVGKATGLSKYLINHDKIYIATLKLGIKTDTADGEGNVIEEKEIPNINEEKINNVFKGMLGEQNQVPPMYSAIKINGKKLYEYARSGRTVKIEPRKITIYDMKLVEYNKTNKKIIFKISCSKGTYIRTVCENVAEKLNTVGYMKELERLKVGEFSIENSVGIEQIKKDPSIIEQNIITIEEFFNNKENINLTEKELNIFLNGGKLIKILENDIYNIYVRERYIGIGRIENNNLKRDIVI